MERTTLLRSIVLFVFRVACLERCGVGFEWRVVDGFAFFLFFGSLLFSIVVVVGWVVVGWSWVWREGERVKRRRKGLRNGSAQNFAIRSLIRMSLDSPSYMRAE